MSLPRLRQTVREFPEDINVSIVSVDTTYRGASGQITETKIIRFIR